MLQKIGDKLKGQRWLATIVLGLLALIFAVWGAYGVVNISFGPPDYGLKVNGETHQHRDDQPRLAGAPGASTSRRSTVRR